MRWRGKAEACCGHMYFLTLLDWPFLQDQQEQDFRDLDNHNKKLFNRPAAQSLYSSIGMSNMYRGMGRARRWVLVSLESHSSELNQSRIQLKVASQAEEERKRSTDLSWLSNFDKPSPHLLSPSSPFFPPILHPEAEITAAHFMLGHCFYFIFF